MRNASMPYLYVEFKVRKCCFNHIHHKKDMLIFFIAVYALKTQNPSSLPNLSEVKKEHVGRWPTRSLKGIRVKRG